MMNLSSATSALLVAAGLSLSFAVGCSQSEDDGFSAGDVVVSAFSMDVAASQAIGTVLTTDWTMVLDGVEDAYVVYGTDGQLDRTAEVEVDGQNFSGLIVGLKPQTEYEMLGVVVSQGVTYKSSQETFRTGGLPASIPSLDVTIDSNPEAFDGYLVTTFVGDSSTPAIIDRDGDVVWWYEPEGEKVKVFRTQLSLDGRSVLMQVDGAGYGLEGSPDYHPTRLVRVGLDGTVLQDFPIPNAHHDFVELPDGNLAFIVGEQRTPAGWDTTAAADTIVEVAAGSSDGQDTEVIWSAWDTWEFSDPDPNVDGSWDLTHANAIDYDADAGTYAVSLYTLGTIVTVDRATGEVLKEIGGQFSDYKLPDGKDLPFEIQHQFQFVDGGVLLFDNGTVENTTSRALELTLDSSRGEAEVAWQHVTNPPLYCPALGDVTRFDDGRTLVTWSLAGQMDLVSPEGDVEWRLNVALGAGLGYTTHIREFGGI